MLDISMAELGIATIVGLLVLGPQEMAKIARLIKKGAQNFNAFYKKNMLTIQDMLEVEPSSSHQEEAEMEGILIDDEGNVHKTYNLEALRPHLVQSSRYKQVTQSKRQYVAADATLKRPKGDESI